jgi:hypothetical protein
MEVQHWQQFICPGCKPLITSVGLALRAMPITTRVERDGAMAALRTGIYVAAQSSCTAVLDGTQNL